MANIWEIHNAESPHQGKAQTSFTKWRVLAYDRIQELTGLSEHDAGMRLHNRGLHQLGLDYDSGMTADQLAIELTR
jgi:hypothetical protein